LTKFDGFEPQVRDWFRRLESERPEHVRSTRSGVLTPERVVGAETGSCPPPLCATTRAARRRLRERARLAIRARIPLDVLRETIQPLPTFSEIYLAALKALDSEIVPAQRVAEAAS
jgi:hypothetical protein